MPPVGFDTTISGSKRPQTYALDRVATGTGTKFWLVNVFPNCFTFAVFPKKNNNTYLYMFSLFCIVMMIYKHNYSVYLYLLLILDQLLISI